jgi:hypothetical protein
MDEGGVLYAIAESCPVDTLLIRDMKRAVNSLFQLNLKRFRVPQKAGTKYCALDVMKQALELLFEFSPSKRNYREAMRTIEVYSENDDEMLRTLMATFSLIANAVYNAFIGQKHAESLAPEILFLQGIPFGAGELQQPFRFVGVIPPDVNPASVREVVFLDANFEPYKLLLDGKLDLLRAQHGREEHWARVIESKLSKTRRTALIRAGAEHVDRPKGIVSELRHRINPSESGRLPTMLRKKGIQIKVVHRTLDINQVFGKRHQRLQHLLLE